MRLSLAHAAIARPAALALATLVAAACFRGRHAAAPTPGGDTAAAVVDEADLPITVEVRSEYIGPVNIYVVARGSSTRLGQVAGTNVERFTLDPKLYGGTDVRLVGYPVGGNGRANSGSLSLRGGNVVQFNLAIVLAQSSVFIR